MNENPTGTGNGVMSVSLAENEHVKELFGILHDNGKDTSGLSALINHVMGMEDFVKVAESRIVDMKKQLAEMKEVQDHPVKTALQKTIKALEQAVAEVKAQIAYMKASIIDGCKNAVAAFKEKGVAVLDKLASFFRIKSGLQIIKNETTRSINHCNKAIASIDSFSKEYHRAGMAIKNMARIAIGKKPVDTAKEAGKLAKIVSAPYKSQKSCMVSIKNLIDKTITALDNLGKKAEVNRDKAAKVKKPTLMERLEAKNKEIKEREREAPNLGRTTKAQGMEV